MMIQVCWAYTDQINGENFEEIEAKLSSRAKSKLNGFKRSEDKKLFLLASGLLLKMLSTNGFSEYQLIDLEYTQFGKPFFPNSKFNFNLSHTDDCVALVFSEECRVGIDIERIKAIDLSDYHQLFSPSEWEKIYAADDKNKQFYKYWTQLESVVKADGRGFSLLSGPPIKLLDNCVIIDEQTWFTKHQIFDTSISCCIASNTMRQISLSQISSLI